YSNTAFSYFVNLCYMNDLITVLAIIAAAAQLIFFYNFFHSIFFGKKGPSNPWGATTLEWTAPQKHIHGNWPGPLPTVYRWPYDYSKLNKDETDYVIPGQDFIPQNVPLQPNEDELDH